MEKEEHGGGGSEDDSEDEDYQPGNQVGGNGNVSDEDGKEWKPKGKAKASSSVFKTKEGKSSIRKRKREGMQMRQRNGNGNDEDSEESDDLSDEDYVQEKEDDDEEVEEEEEAEDPEVVAAREKAEKERIDSLWLDFKSDVEELKTKGGGRAEMERVVTKTYEFAGQTVKVQEKVKGPPSKSKSKKDANNADPEAEASSSSEEGNETDKRPYTRISFLSGDPADIGLSGGGKKISAKEAIHNVLNALKAQNKKLGTLDKTKLDWEAYKRDQNIEEEMEIHRRSRHGYIDKQEFLHRSDLRQFELEKAARTKRRKTSL